MLSSTKTTVERPSCPYAHAWPSPGVGAAGDAGTTAGAPASMPPAEATLLRRYARNYAISCAVLLALSLAGIAIAMYASLGAGLAVTVPASGLLAGAVLLGWHVTIPAGTSLMWMKSSVGRNADLFEEPARFLPERFCSSASQQQRESVRSVAPFGAGPRHCIGHHRAEAQRAVLLAMVLSRTPPGLDSRRRGAAPDGHVGLAVDDSRASEAALRTVSMMPFHTMIPCRGERHARPANGP
jgi:hypothetical protein